jgi:hypothetical protein
MSQTPSKHLKHLRRMLQMKEERLANYTWNGKTTYLEADIAALRFAIRLAEDDRRWRLQQRPLPR